MLQRETNRSPGPVRRWLRDATADVHARTDAVFGAFDLGCPQALACFLAAQHAALASAERELRAHDARDWADVVARRLDAIRSDLDVAPNIAVSLRTPEPLGVAYVVAGSLHGTSVLRTRYRDANPDQDVPRFFSAADWKPMWADVLASLERRGEDAAVLLSARRTFEAFSRAGEAVAAPAHLEPAA